MALVEREVETKYGVAMFRVLECESCGKEDVNNSPDGWYYVNSSETWTSSYCSADCVRTRLAADEAKSQG